MVRILIKTSNLFFVCESTNSEGARYDLRAMKRGATLLLSLVNLSRDQQARPEHTSVVVYFLFNDSVQKIARADRSTKNDDSSDIICKKLPGHAIVVVVIMLSLSKIVLHAVSRSSSAPTTNCYMSFPIA